MIYLVSKVIITRSAEGNASFSKKLKLQGIDSLNISTMRFRAMKNKAVLSGIKQIDSYDCIIVSSKTAARCMLELMPYAKAGMIRNLRFFAAGPSTSSYLESKGIRVDFAPQSGGSRIIKKIMLKKGFKKIAVLRGDASGIGWDDLRSEGLQIDEIQLYYVKTAKARKLLKRQDVLGCSANAIFSPTAIEGIRSNCNAGAFAFIKKIPTVCIGKSTMRKARAEGFRHVILARPNTEESMIAALKIVMWRKV